MSTGYRPIIVLCAFLATLLIGIVIGAWTCTGQPAPAGQWQPATPDDRIADAGTTTVQPRDCRVVVAKLAAKDKLDLPTPIKADVRKHITAAVVIPPDERPQSVVSIFDETTGQTETLTQRMSYPMLATEQRGQLWLGYGVKNGGERVGRILLREDLLQVMALHAGVAATVDVDGGYFVGAGVAYRW